MKNSISKLKLLRVYDEYHGNKTKTFSHKIIEVKGGLNGWGDWSVYLADLLTLLNFLKGTFRDAWIIDLDINNPSDIWVVYIGVQE